MIARYVQVRGRPRLLVGNANSGARRLPCVSLRSVGYARRGCFSIPQGYPLHFQNALLDNFAQAGVAAYIDARLADAHTLVKELPGPFDFVFADADKEWYTQYFQDIEPKLTAGGCFTAHNVRDGFAGAEAFLAYVQRHPGYTTTVDRTSRAGIAISCKTAQ